MKEKGFTLIELLVTMTIVLLLSGAALATFLDYQERRQVQEDATNVANRLRVAQVKATAVEVPSGCSSVDSYEVTMMGSSLTVEVVCPGGDVSLPELNLTLVNSVFDNGPLTVTFDSQSFSANSTTINVCGNGIMYEGLS